jgi:hypothetical protein
MLLAKMRTPMVWNPHISWKMVLGYPQWLLTGTHYWLLHCSIAHVDYVTYLALDGLRIEWQDAHWWQNTCFFMTSQPIVKLWFRAFGLNVCRRWSLLTSHMLGTYMINITNIVNGWSRGKVHVRYDSRDDGIWPITVVLVYT